MGLESSDDWADFYGDQETDMDKIESPAQVMKKLNSVTANDVQKLAKSIFKVENMTLSILGPHKDSKKFSKLLK